MGIATMGRVVVSMKLENLKDRLAAEAGHISPSQVRSVEVNDALVDTGATRISLPKSIIAKLGLDPTRMRKVRTTVGLADSQMYSAVNMFVQERDCICDVAEVPDDCPVLLGQVPLELMDFVVDPIGQRLIGNPAHGGEWMTEQY
jgi:predicted aspartyl protease